MTAPRLDARRRLEVFELMLRELRELGANVLADLESLLAEGAAGRDVPREPKSELDRQVDEYKQKTDLGQNVTRADALWLLNELIYERDHATSAAPLARSERTEPE